MEAIRGGNRARSLAYVVHRELGILYSIFRKRERETEGRRRAEERCKMNHNRKSWKSEGNSIDNTPDRGSKRGRVKG